MLSNANTTAHEMAIPPALNLIAAGRDFVTTNEAALALNRRPQTMHKWACYGGPIRPVRQFGKLGWRVSDLARLMNGEV